MQDLTSSGCASDLRIDEALAGELPGAARAQLDDHLERCAHCRARYDGIAAEREAFLTAAPTFEALAERRAAAPRRARGPWVGGVGGVVGAAAGLAVAAVVFLSIRAPAPPHGDALRGSEAGNPVASATRSKGGPRLGLFIKRGARVTPGQSGARVRPGDRVRFTYSSSRPRYFGLLNLDARRASVYYPSGGEAARVAAGSAIPLDFSVELDDTLGSERVFGVFCDAPFALEPLRRALDDKGGLQAPAGCAVDVVELRKEPAR